MPVLLVLALALSVQEGGARLRSSCDSKSPVKSELDAGAPVKVQYSLAGQSEPCYRVQVRQDGKLLEGYLSAGDFTDLDSFEAARTGGAPILVTQDVLRAVGAPSVSYARAGGTLAEQAAELIEASQPGRALAMLEPELKKKDDPGLLALAGAAAWRADDPDRALELWRKSLALQPNKDVRDLVTQVERETKGDRSKQRLVGSRVLLRYEDTAISVDTARQMTAAVDQEFARVSQELGCSTSERIVTIAQSKEAYAKTTAAAEWSAGQFDGRIRVPVFDGKSMDPELRRTLAHEVTHACISMLGRWPAWVHEGIAQAMSGETFAGDPAGLVQRAKAKKMTLAGSAKEWSNLDAASAALAYQLALRGIELLKQDAGTTGLRNLLHNPARLPQVTSDLDRRLGL